VCNKVPEVVQDTASGPKGTAAVGDVLAHTGVVLPAHACTQQQIETQVRRCYCCYQMLLATSMTPERMCMQEACALGMPG
jgi:hypothetical protein